MKLATTGNGCKVVNSGARRTVKPSKILLSSLRIWQLSTTELIWGSSQSRLQQEINQRWRAISFYCKVMFLIGSSSWLQLKTLWDSRKMNIKNWQLFIFTRMDRIVTLKPYMSIAVTSVKLKTIFVKTVVMICAVIIILWSCYRLNSIII